MKCKQCGAWTSVVSTRKVNDYTLQRRRECGNHHRMNTFEVTEAVWGSIKVPNERASAAALRRAALAQRNREIRAAITRGVSRADLAMQYQLTPSSIHLIQKEGS